MTAVPARLLLPVALLLGALAQPAGAACARPEPEDPPLSLDVPTLSLALSAERPTYRRGQRAVVVVDVTTVAGLKAEDAEVAVELYDGSRLIKKLYGRTVAGRTRLPVTAPSGTSRGRVSAVASARLAVVASYDCRAALLNQYGDAARDPLFSVR